MYWGRGVSPSTISDLLSWSQGLPSSPIPHLLTLEASTSLGLREKSEGAQNPVSKCSSISYSLTRKDFWYLFSRALKGQQSPKKKRGVGERAKPRKKQRSFQDYQHTHYLRLHPHSNTTARQTVQEDAPFSTTHYLKKTRKTDIV